MKHLLNRPIMSELVAQQVSWTMSFVLLYCWTEMLLFMLPELQPGVVLGVLASAGAGWLVLYALLPRVLSPRPVARRRVLAGG